jgi:hypothetical protein
MSFMTIKLMEWTMSETQATRWTRYGQDRVYVKLTETGQQIGWIDVKTGTVAVDDPAHTTLLLAAATNWRAGNSNAGWSVEPPATVATVTGALPPPPLPGWAAPVGLPMPLPPPLAAPDASDDWPVNVAEELTSLPPGWHAVSSEHTGAEGSGFAHIVIGPAGVFTVTTTSHPEGVQNSQFEADRATRLLDQAGLVDIQVQAAIVVVGADFPLQNNSDVIVTTPDNICHTLLSLPTTLTPLQVQSVYKIAHRNDTWIERVQPKG